MLGIECDWGQKSWEPNLVGVAGVGIDGSAGFVFHGHLQLVGSAGHDRVAFANLAIVGDRDVLRIFRSDVHRNTIEVVAVLDEHESLGTFLSNGVGGHNKHVVQIT